MIKPVVRNAAGAAVLIALLLTCWWISRNDVPAPIARAAVPSAPSAAPAAVRDGPNPKPATPPQVRTAALPVKLVDLRRRRDMEREMIASPDLLEFVRAHLPEARSGDGEVQQLLSEALQLCASIEADILAPGSELRAALNNPAADAAQRKQALSFSRRCDALTSAQAETGTSSFWRDLAAERGVGAALLEQAGDPQRSAGQRLVDFRRALSTVDPSVVMMLTYAGPYALNRAEAGGTAEMDFDGISAAQALVQCKLGYDCSSTGAVYEDLHCKSKRSRPNCQRADDVQRYYELSLNPQRFAAVDEYASTLVANMRSGNDDWPEAQTLEQKILQPDDQGEGQGQETK